MYLFMMLMILNLPLKDPEAFAKKLEVYYRQKADLYKQDWIGISEAIWLTEPLPYGYMFGYVCVHIFFGYSFFVFIRTMKTFKGDNILSLYHCKNFQNNFFTILKL
jgi:hypothetical protein